MVNRKKYISFDKLSKFKTMKSLFFQYAHSFTITMERMLIALEIHACCALLITVWLIIINRSVTSCYIQLKRIVVSDEVSDSSRISMILHFLYIILIAQTLPGVKHNCRLHKRNFLRLVSNRCYRWIFGRIKSISLSKKLFRSGSSILA